MYFPKGIYLKEFNSYIQTKKLHNFILYINKHMKISAKKLDINMFDIITSCLKFIL